MNSTLTIWTSNGLDQGSYSEEEEEGGERWAPNKAGPMRPPLLNGIKWELLWNIEKYYRLDRGFILGGGGGRKEGERRKTHKPSNILRKIINFRHFS